MAFLLTRGDRHSGKVHADPHRNEPRVRLVSGAAIWKSMAYFFHEQRQTEAREDEAKKSKAVEQVAAAECRAE